MANAAGNDSPKAADVKKILSAIGADVDDAVLKALMTSMEGKDVKEVLADGLKTLQNFGGGGGGAPGGDEEEESTEDL